jgi:endogenous inhibitor of DNA gyrase (YacG/DUF329 family)
MVDLGAWLSESRSIPGDAVPEAGADAPLAGTPAPGEH